MKKRTIGHLCINGSGSNSLDLQQYLQTMRQKNQNERDCDMVSDTANIKSATECKGREFMVRQISTVVPVAMEPQQI